MPARPMTGAEAVLLLLGLAAGALIGAVLLSQVRGRLRRPDIRVTITHDALPSRGGAPSAGGPGDLADDGGHPVHVAGGTDPLLEQLLAPSAADIPRNRLSGIETVAAGPPARLNMPALAIAGAGAARAGNGGGPYGDAGDGGLNLVGARMARGERVRPHDAPGGISDLRAAQPARAMSRMDPGDPPNGSEPGSAGGASHAAIDRTTPQSQPSTSSRGPTGPDRPGGTPAPGPRPDLEVSASTGGSPAFHPQEARDIPGEGRETSPAGILPPEATVSGEGVPSASVPCADERRLVAERCSVATRAREAHQIAQDAFRATQREYDRTVESVERARKVVDGRRILDEKSEAQRRFRAARLSARTPAEIELAASTWLHDVNRINAAVRQGNVQLAHGRERTSQLVVELERMSARLDAARIASATAEQDCQAAREALAECEEARSGSASVAALQAQPLQPAAEVVMADGAAATVAPTSPASIGSALPPSPPEAAATPSGPASPAPQPPTVAPGPGAHGPAPGAPPVAPPGVAPPGYADDSTPLGRAPYGATPMVLRILRGDREALDRVVTVLAAGSDSEARRWHLDLGALVDAIVAAAIDAAVLDLPQDHVFWGTFSPAQARQVAGVLGGLGSRYDGRGGFADGRVPSARDLALAVGYTGMDPRRVRHWPNEAQMAELYRGVAVAADTFVTEGAPELTLGQMVGLLGRHAEALTALWDEWGRVRPLLLAAGS